MVGVRSGRMPGHGGVQTPRGMRRRGRPFLQQPTGSPSAQGLGSTSQPLPPALSTGGLDNCAGSARLPDGLGRDQLRAFVADVADRLRHRMHAPHGVRAGGKELAKPLWCAVPAQPWAVVGGLQDHRHALVQRLQGLVCCGGDDGEGVDRCALGANPSFPKAGKAEQFVVGGVDVIGLLAAGGRPPFVEAGCRHDAAARPVGRAEGGLLGQRLGARIDEPGGDARVLCPAREQAPAQQVCHALAAGALADDGQHLHRSRVVARPEVGRHFVDAGREPFTQA